MIKKWAREKHRREDLELRQIEKDIFNIMDLEGGGYMNQDSKDIGQAAEQKEYYPFEHGGDLEIEKQGYLA